MSLMIWYPLNGDFNHQGVANSTATASGVAVAANGKIGSCYSFNGSTSYIDIDGIPCLGGGSQPFTLAFWINSLENGTRGVIVGNYNLGYGNFNIEINNNSYSDNRLRFYWSASPDYSDLSNTIIPYNTWAHIAITYGEGKLTTYVNGVKKNEKTVTLSVKNNPMLRLGRDQRTGATALSGYLNDFRIYDEALGITEIQDIARALVLHYDFNDPDVSTVVYDSSGYGRNGIISSITAPTLNDESICGTYSMNWGEANNNKLVVLPILPFVNGGTVVYWYKQPSTYAPTLILKGQSSAYYIMATNASRSDFYSSASGGSITVYVDGVQTNINPKDDKWHLLVAANVNFSTWTMLHMGQYAGYNLNGKVADIKIYNTVLSASDIKRLYEVQTAITNTNNLLTTEVVETDFGNLHNILPFSAYENRTFGSVYNASGWGGDTGQVTYYSEGGFNNLPYKKITKLTTGTGGVYLRDHEGASLEEGKTYVIKAHLKVSRIPFTPSAYNFTINGNPGNKYYNCGKNLPLTTEWQEFSYTVTPVAADTTKSWAEMCIMYDDLEMPFDFYICNFQMYEARFDTIRSVRNNGIVTWPRFIEMGEYQPSGIDSKNFKVNTLKEV